VAEARPGCGTIINESNYTIWAIRDWGDPSIEWDPLLPGQGTPRNQDWDRLSVGCNVSGRIAAWTPPGVWIWRDFSMSAGQTKQIHTHEDAHVRSQSC
jgi:hypothetical protein